MYVLIDFPFYNKVYIDVYKKKIPKMGKKGLREINNHHKGGFVGFVFGGLSRFVVIFC